MQKNVNKNLCGVSFCVLREKFANETLPTNNGGFLHNIR